MFITFEGIDGSGKSSAIKALVEHVKKNYNVNDFIFTREPGGQNLKTAEKIRKFILDNKNEIDSVSESLLYLASRKIHIEKVIKPALIQNKIIICDRYYDSSIAYQGNGRRIGMEKIEKLNLLIIEKFLPDYTFYLKISENTSNKRLTKQKKTFDRLENEDKFFFKKVIKGYNFLAKRDKKRFIIIDAEKPKNKVIRDVIENFDKIMKQRNVNI